MSAEARAIVAHFLGRLPEEVQEVALRYYGHEMTHEEIASRVGTSRRTVGNRLVAFNKKVATAARRKQAAG